MEFIGFDSRGARTVGIVTEPGRASALCRFFMKPGDRIAVEIDRVGRIENRIVDVAACRAARG